MMRNMGLKARATVESYTWEANARKVLDTYRALVNRKVQFNTGKAFDWITGFKNYLVTPVYPV